MFKFASNPTKSKKMKKHASVSSNHNNVNNDKNAKKPKYLGNFGLTCVEKTIGD